MRLQSFSLKEKEEDEKEEKEEESINLKKKIFWINIEQHFIKKRKRGRERFITSNVLIWGNTVKHS